MRPGYGPGSRRSAGVSQRALQHGACDPGRPIGFGRPKPMDHAQVQLTGIGRDAQRLHAQSLAVQVLAHARDDVGLSATIGERKCTPLPGVLQNDLALLVIDQRPLLDFLQGTKAAETDVVIVEAAISYARGLSGVVDVTHWCPAHRARHSNLITPVTVIPGNSSHGQAHGPRAAGSHAHGDALSFTGGHVSPPGANGSGHALALAARCPVGSTPRRSATDRGAATPWCPDLRGRLGQIH